MLGFAMGRVALGTGSLIGLAAGAAPGVEHEGGRFPRNAEEFDQMFSQIKNWGRWGADDRLGTVNLITRKKAKEAAALVRLGRTVGLGHPTMTETAVDNAHPFVHRMNPGFSSDVYETWYHGGMVTHFDALCHRNYKGLHYNGFPVVDVNKQSGCVGLDVMPFKDGLVTRGVLIDLPRLRGLPYVEPGTAVFVEDIEAWEKQSGVKVTSGDALYLHTGRWARRNKEGAWDPLKALAGFHASVLPWLKDRGVAILGCDGVSDVFPSRVTDVFDPIHVGTLAGLGLPLLDNLDTEAVAQVAGELRRWEFMTSIAPMAVPGGTGSPLNILAAF